MDFIALPIDQVPRERHPARVESTLQDARTQPVDVQDDQRLTAHHCASSTKTGR